MPELVCYSKRLLNPFSGVVQVLDADNARAISTDGINWRIQILSETFKTPWHELEFPGHHERYFVYGIWSKTDGLSKAPIHPTLYQEHVEQAAEDLIELLSKQHNNIPFPARDVYECWLLDKKKGQLLALVNSCISDQLPDFPAHINWTPCENHDNSFTSQAFNSRQKKATIKLHAKDVLREIVKKQAGSAAAAIWVKRDEQGQGQLIKHNQQVTQKVDEFISVENFPALGIKQHWHSEDEQQLFNEYIQWSSPRLLTLSGLSQATRAQLEIAAQHRPLEVEKFYRLYPDIVDQSLLNKILVEATLRRNISTNSNVEY